MEHIEGLRKLQIPYEIVPGISSGLLAGAVLGIELTYPQISNSIIFTRVSGKTGGATEEEILKLATTNSTLVFFLSSALGEKLSQILGKVYPPDKKVTILYKLSRKEQKVILTQLSQLTETLKRENISKTALIVIGEVLELIDKNFNIRSKLYGQR